MTLTELFLFDVGMLLWVTINATLSNATACCVNATHTLTSFLPEKFAKELMPWGFRAYELG